MSSLAVRARHRPSEALFFALRPILSERAYTRSLVTGANVDRSHARSTGRVARVECARARTRDTYWGEPGGAAVAPHAPLHSFSRALQRPCRRARVGSLRQNRGFISINTENHEGFGGFANLFPSPRFDFSQFWFRTPSPQRPRVLR